MGSKEMEEEEDEGPPPGWQSIPLPSSQPPAPPSPSEMAQMVCGTCHNLLKYPRGARHVHCSCCHTGNFVLEAQIIVDLRPLSSTFDTKFQIIMTTHEVGLVKCGSCEVLLMYQHGASSVKCSSCFFVTEIGEHNRRPPWSVQQGQPPQPPNPAH